VLEVPSCRQYEGSMNSYVKTHKLTFSQRSKLVTARIAEFKSRQQLGRLGKETVRACVCVFEHVHICTRAAYIITSLPPQFALSVIETHVN